MLATASALNPPISANHPPFRSPAPPHSSLELEAGWETWLPIVEGILTQPEAEHLLQLLVSSIFTAHGCFFLIGAYADTIPSCRLFIQY